MKRALSGRVLKTAQKIDQLLTLRAVSIPAHGGYNMHELRVVSQPIADGLARILESVGPFYRVTTKSGRGKGPDTVRRLIAKYFA